VIDCLVLLDDRELAGVHPHDRAAPQRLLHSQVVFRGQRGDRRLVAMDDHVDRLRPGGEVVREILAETRAPLRFGRLQGGQDQEERDDRGGDHVARIFFRERLRPPPAQIDHRLERHALRPAQRPDGLQTTVANPVINGTPRHAEQFGGVVDRDAASDTRSEAGIRRLIWQGHWRPPVPDVSARPVPELPRFAISYVTR
jgi:hypothetical protein